MSENKKSSKRSLTSAERAAWREATRLAKKLAHAQDEEEGEEEELVATIASAPALKVPPPVIKKSSASTSLPPLAPGKLTDMDGALAARFRKGTLPIEARLDLHGHTREEADLALEKFILRAQVAGKRMLLVITGKGQRGARQDGEAGGVIKRAVEGWLSEGHVRSHILAFTQARQKDGGAGAFYVLLKRKRIE